MRNPKRSALRVNVFAKVGLICYGKTPIFIVNPFFHLVFYHLHKMSREIKAKFVY